MFWLIYYWIGMLRYDQENPPTLSSAWNAFTDEFSEFLEAIRLRDFGDMVDEVNDVVHSGLRLSIQVIVSIPLLGSLLHPGLILLPALGIRTARKHALRYKEYGCIRSNNHCLKDIPDHNCLRTK